MKLAIPRWRLLLGRPGGLAASMLAIGLLTFAYLRSRGGIDAWGLGTLITGAIAAGLGIRSMAGAAGTGELLVFHDRLVIENRYIFKEAIAIPKELIRAIAVDASPGDRRFPVRTPPVDLAALFDRPSPPQELLEHEDAGFDTRLLNVPDHLYTPENALLLPNVSEPNGVPNVTVLFREPLFMRPLRLQPGYVVRGRFPSSTEVEWGFWARAQDPEMARNTLSFAGDTRDLEAEDVLPLLPRLHVLPAMRKRQILLVAFFIGLAAIRVAGEFWDADTSTAPVSESDYCDEGQLIVEEILTLSGKPTSSKGRATTRAITQITPPQKYEPTEGAFGELDDVAESRRGHAGEWRVRLQALDFVTAYRQIWTAGSEAINVEVTEFEEYPAAVDYLSWELLYGCSTNEIFRVPGVVGAVGREADDGNGGRVMFVYFARGGRAVSVSHWNREGDVDREMAFALAREAATAAETRNPSL